MISGHKPCAWGYWRPRFWPTWLLLCCAWIMACIPQVPAMGLGRLLGRLGYLLARRRREVAATNLALCFPELDAGERHRLLQRHFESLGMALVETAFCWYLSPARLKARLVSIEGQEHFHDALQKGCGVILLAAHFTHLEIGSTLLGLSHSGAAVYRPHRNPLLEATIQARRGRHNVAGRLVTKSDPRGMLRVLRDNHFLWYSADQDYRGPSSVFVPFFGIPAATNAAILRLARLSGAPVLPFYQTRLADNRGYRLVFLRALTPFGSADEDEDLCRINGLLESMIRQQPADYLWVHRRFKTRPPGVSHPIYTESRKVWGN